MREYDSARIYIDRALTIAKGYDIKYQLVKLYIMSGDCHKDMIDISSDKKGCIDNAKQLYKMASDINKSIDNNALSKIIAQKMKELDIQCKAIGIAI